MNFLKKIFIEWEIPWYIYFFKYGGWLGIFALWVLWDVWTFKWYGKIGWNIFTLIMLISPLAIIFPKIKFFLKLKWLRRSLWIIAWSYMLAHVFWYFLHYYSFTSPLSMIMDPTFWSLKNWLLWGTLWFLIALPLLLTSNNFSLRILKWNWKKLHSLAHFLFIFIILHIIFISQFKNVWVLIFFIIYLVLHTLRILKISF